MFTAGHLTPDEERLLIQRLTDRLLVQFSQVPPASVREVVNAAWAGFDGCPIRAFVPVLVERAARQHLGRSSTR